MTLSLSFITIHNNEYTKVQAIVSYSSKFSSGWLLGYYEGSSTLKFLCVNLLICTCIVLLLNYVIYWILIVQDVRMLSLSLLYCSSTVNYRM